MLEENKIVYIHGRPSGHPIHDGYAEYIGAKFLPEDYLMPYIEKNSNNKFLRYISWIFNAFYLGIRYRKVNVILTECVRIPLWISYIVKLLPAKVIKVALMADESLYFTHTKKYPKLTLWLMKQYFLEMDYLICVGAYQEELAKKILPISHHSKIKRIFNGLSTEKMETLQKIEPNLEQNRWIFIGNIIVPFRLYYKGVDLMLESLALLDESVDWSLDIVGECPIEIQQELLSKIPNQIRPRINFLGIQNIKKIASDYSLCIHVARGDSYPTSVIEMTAAGIPTIVSEETGTKEIIEKIDTSFVVPLDKNKIAEQINLYLNCSKKEKVLVSHKCKLVSNTYNSTEAKILLSKTIKKLIV